MKKYNYHILRLVFAGFILFLSACGDETGGLTNEVDTTERLLIVAAQMHTEVMTRTATELKEGSIGVFRKTANGYGALNNVCYTWNNTTQRWESADEIYVDNRNAEVYAYYPYSSSRDNNTVFNLSMQRYTPETAIEFYSGTQQVNNSTALVNFAMKSGYSRITFRLLNKNLSACRIKQFKIDFNSNIKADGSIDISTANPTVSSTATTVATYSIGLTDNDSIYKTGIDPGQTDETIDLLMIPEQNMPDININVLIDNAPASVTIPASAFSGALEQGKQYIIPLIIVQGGTAITFDTKQIPGLGPNTVKDPYEDNKLTVYTLPPVILSENLQIATGNLYYYESQIINANKNPNYSLDGKNNWYRFATRNGQMWTGPGEENVILYNKFTYTPSMSDYCQRVGSNWKIPTGIQLQELSSLAKINGTCNDGGSNVSGWWIGAYNTGDASYQKNAIFLTNGTYLASDNGYLTVNGSGVTYTASVAPANSFIRCINSKKE